MISGGFAGGGESSSSRKAHLRSIRSAEIREIQAVSKLSRLYTSITFFDSDLEGCEHPHDDPLVVRAVVANKTVHRVLVDNGSSADIIFASAFDKIRKGKIGARQHTSTGVFWGKGITFGLDITSVHPRIAPLPSDDDSKIPHSRRPVCL